MNTNDLELYDRIKKGDEAAFESLFRTYYTVLCVFSQRIVRDAITAEEIVQDIFFYFWEKRETLDLNISLKSYLFKSVYNNSLKHLRHQKIVKEYESHVKLAENNQYQLQENYVETGEIMQIIHETLQKVSDRSREIFHMNRYDGLKYQEIAEKLGISIKTVEAHMSGLLKLFRESLRDYLPLFILFLWCIG